MQMAMEPLSAEFRGRQSGFHCGMECVAIGPMLLVVVGATPVSPVKCSTISIYLYHAHWLVLHAEPRKRGSSKVKLDCHFYRLHMDKCVESASGCCERQTGFTSNILSMVVFYRRVLRTERRAVPEERVVGLFVQKSNTECRTRSMWSEKSVCECLRH